MIDNLNRVIMLQRGRLDAFQRSDGQWLSSRKAVDAYKKSRHRGARSVGR